MGKYQNVTRRDAIHNLTLFLAGSPLLAQQSGNAQQAGDPKQETPSLEEMINVFDFEPVFKANTKKAAYDYVRGGGWDEWTLRRNREAFGKVTLRPRYLREVAELDLSTTLFGKKLSMPIFVAPTGTHGVVHPDGEPLTARGAGAADAVMVVSTSSSYPIDQIAAAATGPLWFQLYAGPDVAGTRERVDRALAAGCEAICFTVDAPYAAPRERDFRNRLSRPTNQRPSNPRRRRRGKTTSSYGLEPRLLAYLNWEFFGQLRGWTNVPLLVKGILTPEDAKLAVEHGADGVVVSNHGGRYLDSVPSTIEVLPEIIDQIGGRVPVLIDSGFRRGTDILKALAIGASAVLVGRPPLWGLGAFGDIGVQRVLEILTKELAWAMGLAGRPNIASIDSSLVRIEK